MSKSDSKASESTREEAFAAQAAPVLDFIYHDARRVGSLLTQFEGGGHLVALTEREHAQKSEKTHAKFTAATDIKVVKAGIELGVAPESTGGEALERQLDPIWANAISLLEYVEEKGMIAPNPATARIGQFVRISGILRIQDLRIVTSVLNSKKFMDLMRSVQSPKEAKEFQAIFNKIGMWLELVPVGVVAEIRRANGERFWSGIPSEGLTMAPEQIFLKHGPVLAGEWSILGILDAKPDDASAAAVNVLDPSVLNPGVLDHGMGFILDLIRENT